MDKYYISYVNMDHREDRLFHMKNQLAKTGIEAVRTRGMRPEEYNGHGDVTVMRRRTPGAIGCHFSQVSIMEEARDQGKHAMVLEDDIIFCSDFKERIKHIETFCETNPWDVIWLGAAFHINPPHWHKKGESTMKPNCSAELGYDAKRTEDPRMIRTYGAYNTFAYIVNNKSIDKILALFDRHIHTSIGIDWLFIKLQPQLHCYAYVPGCIKQMDNMSDIGTGMTVWSGHLKNGPYVWQDKLEDFNPLTYEWYEAN
jgi:GR25 family glycosyltransferase involved in LPS biosynthesis